MTDRPNVLWVMTDEQRPDSLGCYGSAWARTPNVDQLARRGTLFRQCHVQSPMCVPSRTSMLTGRYPQETGVFQNDKHDWGGIDPDLVSFPQAFEHAGYRTASLGKWHHPNHPFWQENELPTLFPEVSDPTKLGHGYAEEEHRVIKNPGSFMDTVEIPVIIGGVYPNHDWGTDPASHLTDRAIEWLRDAANNDKPFLLRVSYVWPHTPVLVPRPWDELYDPDEVPCRALDQEALDGRSSYDRWMAGVEQGMEMSADQWRRAAADYYALCAYIDHEVGRLMRALDELGLTDDTIVAFNADHGRAMGEIGLCQKGTFDSEVWRVPFVLTWPGRVPEGVIRDDLCEAIDLGPTLLALADILPPDGMRGRDLLSSEEPEAVFGIVDMFERRRAAVRTDRYRFDCTYAVDGQRVEDEDERDPNLFDLQADPEERHNLARDPAYAHVREDLYDHVDAWMSLGDGDRISPG